MIKGCKICGISDPDTLNFLINHPHPPKFIGFICNYPKSPRYIEYDKLKKLLNINPKQCCYVAVLVKPNREILENLFNAGYVYHFNAIPQNPMNRDASYWMKRTYEELYK